MIALPGSRRSEVSRLAPIFGPALGEFHARRPDLRIVVPAAGPVAKLVQQEVQSWGVDPVVFDPSGLTPEDAGNVKRALFAGADLALAASGTVSLELARARTPMVVAYAFQWLSWQIMRRMALIDTVTLVNLVSDSRVVPECLGPECTPQNIANALHDVARDPVPQEAAMAMTMERLGEQGEAPGLRAARAVLARLGAGDAG
jgi:lipid-A-disaccharide synthase